MENITSVMENINVISMSFMVFMLAPNFLYCLQAQRCPRLLLSSTLTHCKFNTWPLH